MTDSILKTRSPRRDIVFAFVLAAACYVAWLARDVLLLLYVSALLAVVFGPVVYGVANLRIGRWQPFRHIAILILLLAVAGFLVAFGFVAFPPVIRDLEEFSKEMPARSSLILQRIQHIPFLDQLDSNEIYTRFQGFLTKGTAYILSALRDWAGKLASVMAGFVLTIYFIHDGDRVYRWFLSFFSPENRQRLDLTLQRAYVRMGKWLLGQGGLMLILGMTSTIVYLSLHVRYAYALGALTGLLNIVPILGAAICIVLALLVAAIDSWGRVLGVAIFYAVYLQIENSFLTPRIMQSRVGLSGFAVLVALLLGSDLAGVVGAMVAVPTAVLVGELVDEYLVKRNAA